jgi:hypothetical protein
MRRSWLSRLFTPHPQGYDLLADPDLAGFSTQALADLPLWPAPDERVVPPGRPAPVASASGFASIIVAKACRLTRGRQFRPVRGA